MKNENVKKSLEKSKNVLEAKRKMVKTLWRQKLNLRQIEPQVSEDKKGQIGPAKNCIHLQSQDKNDFLTTAGMLDFD